MSVEASAVLTNLNIMSAEVPTDASCLCCSNHSPLIAVAWSRVGVGSGGAIGGTGGGGGPRGGGGGGPGGAVGGAFGAAAAPLPELAAAVAGIGGTGGLPSFFASLSAFGTQRVHWNSSFTCIHLLAA